MKFLYDPSDNRIEKRYYNLDPFNDFLNSHFTHYVRDASGNTLAVYDQKDRVTLTLRELPIYGSSRLGLPRESDTLYNSGSPVDTVPVAWSTLLGDKEYEQTNHLGNVMSTISDKPFPMDTNSNGTTDYYNSDWLAAQDYYPFGMLQPGRCFNGNYYRFGFNGQEKTDEINGSSNHNTALFWEYDTRLGRRWNLDPNPQISISDYASFANNPILFTDLLGDIVEIKGEVKTGPQTEFVTNVKGLMNEIKNDQNGAKVIETLENNPTDVYTITDESLNIDKKGHYGVMAFQANKSGGGTIFASDISKLSLSQSVETAAHEFFHAYQYNEGTGMASVNNEVEAYVFGKGVALNLGYATGGWGSLTNPTGQAYNKAITGLMFGSTFNRADFQSAIKNFKAGSIANSLGLYDKFPITPIPPKPLISNFYPLIK